jgi:ubiquitin C-terminal hydrolase
MESLQYNTTAIFYPCGLANLGNTCFLNTCIQLLNYTDELANIQFAENARSEESVVFRDWQELRELMNSARGKMTNPVATPGKFVKTIHDIARLKGYELFTGWAQNDLPDFLQFMVECIHNSHKRSISVNIRGVNESKTDDLALQCYSMLKNTYETGEYSEVVDILYGVYVSQLFTPDRNTLHSNKPEQYFILDLPIPSGAKTGNTNITLLDCFDYFTMDELLHDWSNERTGKIESVRKHIVFWSFPKVLIITLKRYSSDGRYKNCSFIDFPLDDLDLSKYVIGYKANTYKYKLFGVGNHMGGVMGGHYTAFVQTGDKWHCFNDDAVSEIDERMIVSPSAYCLFYRKK